MNAERSNKEPIINYHTGHIDPIKRITVNDLQLEEGMYNPPISGFVYRILNNKENGSFVEVGSSHWKVDNNTYILENKFGWRGVGLEIQDHFVESYNKNRESTCINANAINFNWDKYFEQNNFDKRIDFLQIDVDDIVPNSNLLALLNIPLSRYRFSVICMEHTANLDPRYESNRNAQREILFAHGYTLAASLFTDDWWIDKKLQIPGTTYDLITNQAWKGNL